MRFKEFKEEVLKDSRAEKLNFEPDERLHYVYRISSLLENSHYYGSKSERIDILKETIGANYFTSSNYIKEDFKANPKNYKVKIIKQFNNSADKMLYESYLHQYFNVKGHDSFINRSNQTPFGFDTTGLKKSPESKLKLSLAQLETHMAIKKDPIRLASRSNSQLKAQTKINSDPIKRKKKIEKITKSLLEFNASFWKDPTRFEERSKKMSEVQQEINNDPERAKERSRKVSEGNIRAHLEMKKNPNKVKQKNDNITKGWLKLLADPNKAKELTKKRSKPIKQYDIEDNFMQEFSSRLIASRAVGLKDSGRLSTVVNHKTKTAGGYRWKD